MTIFENPSYFSLRKMQELVGKIIKVRENDGVITYVDYNKNQFDIIDGYRVSYEIERHRSPYYSRSLNYPSDFMQFIEPGCDLPDEFIADIKQGLERIDELDLENDEKLKDRAAIPVEERIARHKPDKNESTLYKLHMSIMPSFIGGCSALLNIGDNFGDIRLEIMSYHFDEPVVREVSRYLNRVEIDEFYNIYRNYDFLTHERKGEKIGLDGVTLALDFYDGEVSRYYTCWCPDEYEEEFMFVKYMFSFFRECFPYESVNLALDNIRDYFDCTEKI